MGRPQRKVSLKRLVVVFGWLGLIGFGGGLAVLSLMREDGVEREKWLDDEGFVEAVALGQSLPGVIGTNTATSIGLRLRGWMAGIAGTYLNRFRENRWIQATLNGIASTVPELLLTRALIIGQASVHSVLAGVIAVVAGILLGVVHLSPLYILLGSGAMGLLLG